MLNATRIKGCSYDARIDDEDTVCSFNTAIGSGFGL
jgi:hypothetical protein